MTEKENTELKTSLAESRKSVLRTTRFDRATDSEAPDPKVEFAMTGKKVCAPEVRPADSVMGIRFRPFRDPEKKALVSEVKDLDRVAFVLTSKKESAPEVRLAASRMEQREVHTPTETHFPASAADLAVFATTGNPETAIVANRAVSLMRATAKAAREAMITETEEATSSASAYPEDSTIRARHGNEAVDLSSD